MRVIFVLLLVSLATPAYAIKTIGRAKEPEKKPAAAKKERPPKDPAKDRPAKDNPAKEEVTAEKPAPTEKPATKKVTSGTGVTAFPLAELKSPKTVSLQGPNTITIEITRSADTTKATKVRVQLDGKVNKVLALQSETTHHMLTLTPGAHKLGFVAALGKKAEGQVIVRHKGEADVEASSSAIAAGSDIANAPLVDVAQNQPLVIPKGSYLSAIAWASYGDEEWWPAIYEVNKKLIGSDPNKVEKGVELFIPDTETARALMAWIKGGRQGTMPVADQSKGQKIVVKEKGQYLPTPKKKAEPRREVIALMPGNVLTPLMAQLLWERGKRPIAPSAKNCAVADCYREVAGAHGARYLITATVAPEGTRYYVTLTRHDLRTFEEKNTVERNFTRDQMETRLDAALVDVLDGKQDDSAPAAVATPVASVTKPAPTVSDHRYRPYAYGFMIAGGALIVGGGATLAANRVMIGGLERDTAAYNAQAIRTDPQAGALALRRNTQVSLGVASYVGLGLGAAALATGVVLFVLDGKQVPVAVVPFGTGASVAGSF